jgi:hypothetical protein
MLQSGSAELRDRFAPTLLKRIQFSYRPKQIVPLSAAMLQLVPVLRKAGLDDRLVLDQGAPFEMPQPGDAKKHEFQAVCEGLKTPGVPSA